MMFAQISLTLAALVAMLGAWGPPASADAPARPADRVVAAYFHRTVRCPTRQRVGAELERAIESGFAPELADGRLEWQTLDFQDPRNSALVTAFRITGPSFVLMEVRDNRVVAWKPAPRAWGLVGDEAALARYVQAEVRSVLGVVAAAAKPREAR